MQPDHLPPDHRVRCRQIAFLTTETLRTRRNGDHPTRFRSRDSGRNAPAHLRVLLRGLRELRGEFRRGFGLPFIRPAIPPRGPRRFVPVPATTTAALALCCILTSWFKTQAATWIPAGSAWQFRKGTNEASSPITAWRARTFDGSAWPTAPAPFHFGESSIVGGTRLADMQRAYNGVFLRQPFVVSSLSDVSSVTLLAACDDGFVAWLNGIEIARYRMNSGAITYTNLANSSAPEPIGFIAFPVTNYAAALVPGTNLLAIQAFNRLRDNGDFQIDARLEVAIFDPNPPALVAIDPAPGTVAALDRVTVTFNEPVQGVDENDLLVNGAPAEAVSGSGTTYTFELRRLPPGPVHIAWATGHAITDLAAPPNLFDATAPGTAWDYVLYDGTPPVLASVHPPPGAILHALTQIELTFNEVVAGVDPSDLLVNGLPARSVSGIGAGPFVFAIEPVVAGPATFAWSAAHGIVDLATPPNAFVGSSWICQVDPQVPLPALSINEIAAANLAGLTDEDGDAEDWIELVNSGTTTLSLAGWSLSDDPDHPGKWVFPNVTLAAGKFLVVFASGKDRRDPAPGERLHTNFKLADNGEYLGLFNLESPRVPVSEFLPAFPEQRNDIAYGLASNGQWRYFSLPTPGSANGASSITGAVSRVRFSPDRGLYAGPFEVALTNDTPETTLRYTTDGSEPTATSGSVYASPIPITTTTVLRAAGFKTNCLPSSVKTHTYLFPAHVPSQPPNPPGFPATWGSAKVTTGDYAMDPRIATNSAYAASLSTGLANLPSLSLTMPVADWFSPARGIYSNGQYEGMAWERRLSAELLLPDNDDGFQVDCGIRIQGGTSPEPWKSYKLSLRLNFRADYGPSRLEYRLFPDSPVARFDTLVLDAGLNYVWHYGGGSAPEEQRTRAKYVQDQFVSDLQNLTGTPSFHGRFMNVYINGLFWGIYNVHEDPRAAFGADYYGGTEDEYDVLKHTGSNLIEGNRAAWDDLFARARADLALPSNYAALAEVLDVPSLVDYMIVNLYVGNTDWPHHNWYALRRRTPEGRWRFAAWDSEHVLKRVEENVTGVSTSDSPAELYNRLRQNSEFRLLFADRIQRHLFNGGILDVDPAAPSWDPAHPERNRPAALYHQRVNEIYDALVGESARWGDNQRPALPYTRNAEWLTELNWLRTEYFPRRSAAVLAQFRSLGLYPAVDAPAFNQHGGYVPRGFPLALAAPAGAIYYTLDGTDPRIPVTGAIAPGATTFVSGSPVILTNTALVKTRALNGATWSALCEATFQVANLGLPLRPTEIMYHPPNNEALEFVELRNTGPVPIDVSGFRLDGIRFIFPPFTVLAPGQTIVLASDADLDAFAVRYPGVPVFATFEGSLANGGEALTLKYPDGRDLWRLEYRDANGWPPEADGAGFSLECLDPDAAPSDPANWRRSLLPGGSPGASSAPTLPPEIRLNEVYAAPSTTDAAQTHPDPESTPTTSDWIELFNAGTHTANLGGWSLGDTADPHRFVFPAETTLLAGQYLQVWCDHRLQPAGLHTRFGLDRDGESIFLHDSQSNRIDAVSFGNQLPGYTLGRGPNGHWLLTLPTPSGSNSPAPLAAPANLVLNEWLANPLPGHSDWIELFNRSLDLPAALDGLYLIVNDTLARIQAAAFIPPQGHLRLWADEQAGPDRLGLVLPAAGATVELLDPVGAPLDHVTYSAQTEDIPFGRFPDGSANLAPLTAHTPNRPNSINPADSDRDCDGLPDLWEQANGLDLENGAGPEGSNGDPDHDGLTNGAELIAGTHPLSASSRLEFGSITHRSDGLRLEFLAVSGRCYRVEARDTLGAGDGEWNALSETPVFDSTQTVAVTDSDPPQLGTRFYRLRVLCPGSVNP